MSSAINKPTGLGYQGSPWRVCEECGHPELDHYEGRCWHFERDGLREFAPQCECFGFCARRLSVEERRIIEEQRQTERELEYVGEALYRELKREHPSDTRDY